MGPEASFWLYHFLANEKVQGEGYPFYKFFPSGGLRISFWPIEWVGVDADVRGGLVRFSANTGVSVEGGLPFRGLPIGLDGNGREQFLSFKGAAGVAAKARYILHLGNLGVGGGMRLGYRYHAHYAADQYFLDNDRITLIPSYQWHNVALGPELFFSAILFGRRLEVEPKLDLMPVTVYIEGPDWPGRRSLTVGANLSAAARMEIFYGAFVEVYGYSTLGYAQWGSLCQYPWVACNGGEGEAGTRRGRLIDPQTGQREFIQGGTVVNLDGGLQVALGWMW